MKTFSNTYIFLFSVVMVLVVAAGLSVAALVLKPRQDKNTEIEAKRNILSSLGIEATASDAEDLFARYIVKDMAINESGVAVEGKTAETADAALGELPLYWASIEGKSYVVIPLHGKGLWGKIWGFVSLESDCSTIHGATFAHASETPGLGAEIATPAFQSQFPGKKIFDASGSFVGIRVLKKNSYTPDQHSVDAISGGTLTSNGLRDMIKDCLVKYQSYFEQNKKL